MKLFRLSNDRCMLICFKEGYWLIQLITIRLLPRFITAKSGSASCALDMREEEMKRARIIFLMDIERKIVKLLL